MTRSKRTSQIGQSNRLTTERSQFDLEDSIINQALPDESFRTFGLKTIRNYKTCTQVDLEIQNRSKEICFFGTFKNNFNLKARFIKEVWLGLKWTPQ